jgi:hypothetical protein
MALTPQTPPPRSNPLHGAPPAKDVSLPHMPSMPEAAPTETAVQPALLPDNIREEQEAGRKAMVEAGNQTAQEQAAGQREVARMKALHERTMARRAELEAPKE